MSEFQKIKVGYNEYGYNSTIAEYNTNAAKFQQIIDEIIALNLGITFNENDLIFLTEDPKAFFCEKLISEPMTINGLELDKNKVFEIMKKPAELDRIAENILHIKKHGLPNEPGKFLFQFAPLFKILNNTVIISTETESNVSELYSIYIKTEKQKQINDILEIIVLNLNALKQIEFVFNYEDLFKDLITINQTEKITQINYKKVSNIK